MPENTGKIVGVNGNMLTVEFDTGVSQNEVAYVTVGEERLKCEVIRVRGNRADMQIFESANGIAVGDKVEFTGELLSVELGPGLLTSVYDGLQNPLNVLAEEAGFFLKRGLYLNALDREKVWEFTPTAQVGDTLQAGDRIGFVPEGIFQHYIMVPFAWRGEWKLTEVTAPGSYTVDQVMATAVNEEGESRTITMVQLWPVKIPISDYAEKLLPRETLVTQTRIIDTFSRWRAAVPSVPPGPSVPEKLCFSTASVRMRKPMW